MKRWQREVWSGLGRGKNWINRPFEENDAHPVWIDQLMGIAVDLKESLYITSTNAWSVLGRPRKMVFEWQHG